ncbi:methyltransferase domain-containing protein [Marichromatium bheemlicum]|uniref:Methyltransferase domain-containing protein n=1 Tax=Marichromatium bheemlicum TaxID=365339 RepID=A0ABX1I9J7_9GAMM|nr:methyltransferase domain-containing protein [Marichromatium bheemlicum]NKN33649.1 methyltransferase domain-containing protein [Marichromatium bheemlicum]
MSRRTRRPAALRDASTQAALVDAFRGGDLSRAATLARRLTATRPGAAFGWKALGSVLLAEGRPRAAVAALERALALSGDDPECRNTLGRALLDLGEPGRALEVLERARALRPADPMVLGNLGAALQALGRTEAALVPLGRAVALAPDSAAALNNQAGALLALGRTAVARPLLERALALDPELVQARANWVRSVETLRPDASSPALRGLLVRALDECWCMPQRLLVPSCALLHAEPVIAAALARVAAHWPGAPTLAALGGAPVVAALLADALMMALLPRVILGDVGLERLLTLLRRALLIEVEQGRLDAAGLALLVAIAQQCELAEFVHDQTDDEAARVAALRAELAEALRWRAPVVAERVAAVAAYLPLGSIPFAERLLEREWPEELRPLLERQLVEPLAERRQLEHIERWALTEDVVSRRVRAQYERNPYPRWRVSEPVLTPAPDLPALLRQRLPGVELEGVVCPERPEVLVAGCGTGEHAIATARRLREARVVAVDLSLRSLCHARARSEALGVAVRYAQADLLALPRLGRRFDLIEAVGVLHHLDDPVAGARALVECLRPGGVLLLGLYSQRAREAVRRARVRFGDAEAGDGPARIRWARQRVIDAAGSDEVLRPLLDSPDFHSMSGCRDLLFHVQEHCFTPAGLVDLLAAAGLELLGVELDPARRARYRARFPEDPVVADLTRLDAFERADPLMFAGMYRLWVRVGG